MGVSAQGGVCQKMSAQGVVCLGGLCPEGLSAEKGCLPVGGVPRRYIPACTGQGGVYLSPCWDTYPRPMDKILVKTLPFYNYVADGNNGPHFMRNADYPWC